MFKLGPIRPSEFENDSAMPFQIRTTPCPGQPNQLLSVFSGASAAWRHLQNHLLTNPECEAWACICPQMLEIVDLTNADARWQYRQGGDGDSGDYWQPLYDQYAQAVTRAAIASDRLGWHRHDPGWNVRVALGHEGLLQVFHPHLKSAFLPNQGNATEVVAARLAGRTRRDTEARSQRDTMRRHGMRAGRSSPMAFAKTVEQCQRRESGWTPRQTIYHRVFRPAVRFIRSNHRHTRKSNGDLEYRDYALLKEVLPPMSQLSFDDWDALLPTEASES